MTAVHLPRPDRPVFVVGPPRAGTTLVRVALDRHPGLALLNETHLYDLWAERVPGLRDGDPAAFDAFWSRFTAGDDFRWLEVDPDAVVARLRAADRWDLGAVMAALLLVHAEDRGVARVGEKTPDHARHLDSLLDDFPDARVVAVVRDPRATVASELRHDAPWASDDPSDAAMRWARATAGLGGHLGDPRVLLLTYEAVVTSPRTAFARALSHLELPWDEAVVAGGEGHPAYRHGDQDPWARIEAASLETWRSQLDPRALTAVAHRCGRLARSLGYPTPTASLPVVTRLTSAPHRLRLLARDLRHRRRRPTP